jgi:AcrR family transcriptional regulator
MLTETVPTKEKLIRAARALGAREGLAAATTAAIAAEAGVAEGTLYRHFPSKDDLLIEAYRRLKTDVFARVADREDEVGAPGEKLKRIWRDIYDAYRADADGFVYGQRFAESALVEREGGVAAEPGAAALARLLAEGVEAGLFKALPLDLMGGLFWAPIGYLMKGELKGRRWSEAELDAAADAVIDSLRR